MCNLTEADVSDFASVAVARGGVLKSTPRYHKLEGPI